MTIEDKGMPFHKNPFKSGNLFIMFKVSYPETLAPAQQASLKAAFADIVEMHLSASKKEESIREHKTLKKFEES